MKRSMEGAVTAPALQKETEPTSPSKKQEGLGEMFPNDALEAASVSDSQSVFCSSLLSQGKP